MPINLHDKRKTTRFRTQEFAAKLKSAREFKRRTIPLPQTESALFLHRIGLRSIWAKLGIGFVFLLLIFFAYTVGPFGIKNIEIRGVSGADAEAVANSVNAYVGTRGFLGVPQKNFFVFSSSKLSEKLGKDFPQVRGTANVSRTFKMGIVVDVSFRTKVFGVESSTGKYVYYDDGAFANFETPDFVAPIRVWWQGGANSENMPDIPDDFFSVFSRAIKAFHGPAGNSVDFFIAGANVEPGSKEELGPTDFAMYTKFDGADPNALQKGYKVYLDVHANIEENLARLEIIVTKRPLDKQKALYYIDLRQEGRAFLCEAGAVCSQPKAPQVEIQPGTEIEENLTELPPSQIPQVRGATK